MYYSIERFRGLELRARKQVLVKLHEQRRQGFASVAEEKSFLAELHRLEDEHEALKRAAQQPPKTAWAVLLEDD